MKKTLKRLLAGSFAFLFAFAIYSNTLQAQGGQGNAPPESQGETVVDKVAENEDTSEFAALLEQSGFADVLKQQGPFTIVAPSNEALQSSDADVEAIKEDPAQAQKFVQSHLYQGEIPTEQVESSMGVGVEDSDESAANGTVYVVDSVVQQGGQQQQ